MKKIICINFLSIMLIFILGPAVSEARFDSIPYVDNESLGMFNTIREIAKKPSDDFSVEDWGPVAEKSSDGMGYYHRYLVAFTGYGVSMLAENTPAYRKPYADTLDRLIKKLLDKYTWEDWLLASWGGPDPLHPYNIMYTGHLLLLMTMYERQAGNGRYLEDVELVYSPERKFKTNLKVLGEDLKNLIETNVDSKGRKYYGICCETNRVFVPCNAIPHYALVLLGPILGQEMAGATPAWMEWVKGTLLDKSTMYFFDRFKPFDPEPGIDRSYNGAYTSWSYSFIDAFDPAWSSEAYRVYRETSVSMDPFGEGTAVMRDQPLQAMATPMAPLAQDDHGMCSFDGATKALADVLFEIGKDKIRANLKPEARVTSLDFLASIFGIFYSREMDDQELYKRLLKTYEILMNRPAWSEDGVNFGYNVLIMRAALNGLPLLARSISRDVNLRSVVSSPREKGFYLKPVIIDAGKGKVFVNQAGWSGDGALLFTINGGRATASREEIIIENLEQDKNYPVYMNGTAYPDFKRNGTGMVITTPSLSDLEISFQVGGRSSGDSKAGCGCITTGFTDRSGQIAGVLMGLAVFMLFYGKRVFGPGHEQ